MECYCIDEDSCVEFYSKRVKTDTDNHNHVLRNQIPDLIRDAYDFDEKTETHDVEYKPAKPLPHFNE